MNFPTPADYHPKLGNRFTIWLGKRLLKLIGWQLKGPFPKDKKMVVCLAPHTSNWDFFVAIFAVLAMGLKASWMGKQQIFKWPVKGLLLKLGGIAVDRRAAGGLVEQVAEQINQSDSMIFALAPEGTRSKVENWKTGFLRIAKQADVPVYMGYFDFDNKVFGFCEQGITVEDIDAAMAQIRAFYKTIPAKYPELTN